MASIENYAKATLKMLYWWVVLEPPKKVIEASVCPSVIGKSLDCGAPHRRRCLFTSKHRSENWSTLIQFLDSDSLLEPHLNRCWTQCLPFWNLISLFSILLPSFLQSIQSPICTSFINWYCCPPAWPSTAARLELVPQVTQLAPFFHNRLACGESCAFAAVAIKEIGLAKKSFKLYKDYFVSPFIKFSGPSTSTGLKGMIGKGQFLNRNVIWTIPLCFR